MKWFARSLRGVAHGSGPFGPFGATPAAASRATVSLRELRGKQILGTQTLGGKTKTKSWSTIAELINRNREPGYVPSLEEPLIVYRRTKVFGDITPDPQAYLEAPYKPKELAWLKTKYQGLDKEQRIWECEQRHLLNEGKLVLLNHPSWVEHKIRGFINHWFGLVLFGTAMGFTLWSRYGNDKIFESGTGKPETTFSGYYTKNFEKDTGQRL